MTGLRLVTSLCLALGLVGLTGVHQARAAERGSFDFVRVFQVELKTIDIGDGQAVSVGFYDGAGTITKSDGQLFEAGQAFTYEGVAYIKRSPDGIEIEAFLVHSDGESQDTYVTKAFRRSAELEKGSSTQEIVSGSGQFAGITGSCSYAIEYLPQGKGVVSGSCDWQLP